MFDFSFGKIAIFFTLCLVVLGPEKLPKLAAQLGRLAGQARAMARHFRAQLEQEIAAEELKRELKAANESINKIASQAHPDELIKPLNESHAETHAGTHTEQAAQSVPAESESAHAHAHVDHQSHGDIEAQYDLGFDPGGGHQPSSTQYQPAQPVQPDPTASRHSDATASHANQDKPA